MAMNKEVQQNSIFVVTGKIHGGKTGYLAELVTLLSNRGLKIGGFLCPGSFSSGERTEFRLKNIESGMEVAMASSKETASWFRYRRFWFNPDAFKLGQEWITSSFSMDPDVMVIDEVGPMELEGKGWNESLDLLQDSLLPLQLWNVRELLLWEVVERWGIPTERVIHIDRMEACKAAELINEHVQYLRKS